MAAKYWIKLYHELLDDPKMGRLPDRLWRRVIELFLVAGEYDQQGLLPEVGDIAWKLRVDESTLQKEIDAICKTGIVTFRDSRYHVAKFAVRQAAVPDKERQQRSRDLRRKSMQTYQNGVENHEDSHEDVTKRDTDTDTDTDIKSSANANGNFPKSPPKPPKHPERDELIKFFLIKTGLQAPRSSNKTQIKEAQRLWWSPADETLEKVGRDLNKASILVDAAVNKLRKNGMTISDFNSIIKTVRAEYAEYNQAGG